MLVNVVFEGGGVRAIGIVGAVSECERRGVKFHQMAGTSSGSMVAAFLAAGYTAAQIEQMVKEMPFTNFLKRAPIFNTKIIGPAVRLFLKKGLYSGEALERWMYQKLLEKGVRTFADLPANKLRIIASDISQGKLLVLPDDIAQYGIDPRRFPVARAVRMSTAIPYFFDPVIIRKPVKIRKENESFASQFIYIVDGGLLSNFPLWLFDKTEDPHDLLPTLGFQYVGRQDLAPRHINGPISMLGALVSTMLNAHDERYIEDHNDFRTIKIPNLGVPATDFNMDAKTTKKLYESGVKSASLFFDKWSPKTYESSYNKLVIPRLGK